jgi:N-methylhydantoinase A
VLSAFGFLAADVQNEFARTYLRPAEETPAEHVLAAVDELIGEAGDWLESEGVDAADRVFDVFADCRYYRQDIQIPVALERAALDNGYAARLRGDFEGEHRRRYGFDLEANVEIATLRVVGRGTSRDVELKAAAGDTAELAIDRHERVHFDGEWHETPIYERTQLAPGHTIAGPAIVEQEDSTSVIEPGWTGTVDDAGNITVRRQG